MDSSPSPISSSSFTPPPPPDDGHNEVKFSSRRGMPLPPMKDGVSEKAKASLPGSSVNIEILNNPTPARKTFVPPLNFSSNSTLHKGQAASSANPLSRVKELSSFTPTNVAGLRNVRTPTIEDAQSRLFSNKITLAPIKTSSQSRSSERRYTREQRQSLTENPSSKTPSPNNTIASPSKLTASSEGSLDSGRGEAL